MEHKNALRRFTDRLFGGINMSWPLVIILAVGTAALTTLFLVAPVFENTSFYRMGVFWDAWILFAVFIMSNCKKPLESAIKTFVFFLISQPLIYLFQVPFSSMGWSIFMYYKTWFIWTLLTFPAAFIGWYITKKNWLSLLILSPILLYLAYISLDCISFSFRHFPRMLFAGVFCLCQVLLYMYVFTSNIWQKLLGIIVPFAAAAIFLFATLNPSMHAELLLPDEVVFSKNAYAQSSDESVAVITSLPTDGSGIVEYDLHKYGTTDITIKDGNKEYVYTLKVYENDEGHTNTEVTRKK